jgi:hypothetical protein
METAKTITSRDIHRYQHLRETERKLIGRMLKTIPRSADQEIGAALGILHNGDLFFDSEAAIAVLVDCCLHDWIRDGQNLVTKFSLDHPAPPGTDEEYLMRAHQRARFRVLLPEIVAPGAGMECLDTLSGERLFLMDVALSTCAKKGGPLMATRTIPLGEYWATTGAGLTIGNMKTSEAVLRVIKRLAPDQSRVHSHKLELAILRTCLDHGEAEHMSYVGGEPERDEDPDHPSLDTPSPKPQVSPRTAARNDPCPCGSGQKYKRCCLLKPSR